MCFPGPGAQACHTKLGKEDHEAHFTSHFLVPKRGSGDTQELDEGDRVPLARWPATDHAKTETMNEGLSKPSFDGLDTWTPSLPPLPTPQPNLGLAPVWKYPSRSTPGVGDSVLRTELGGQLAKGNR